jgi:hypothetical protein
MKKLINFAALTAVMAMVALAGVADVSGQTRRRPVIRKATVKKKTVVRKPAIPLYTVANGSIIRVRMNGTLSSKTAGVGNTFSTTVTEPVYSESGAVVVPVGSTVIGRVDRVERAQKKGNPGAIDVSFTSIRLPNGRTRAINGSLTDLESKTAKSDAEGTAAGDKMKHRKIIFIGGGAGGGALLGAAVGGGKGALIGGIIGGIGGFLGERYTKGEEAQVKSGTEFGVVLNQSISLPKFVETTP